ncbi:MAG: transcription elongation factor GreB, partial [Gammaproteobacteria bacterium]
MGRWRPPSPQASPYITADGYRKLETELAQAWKRRAVVTSALTAAAAEGDRSENAEYIYRKKELREIDRRIRYLQQRLPELHVVTESPAENSRVFFGAWVTLEDSQGKEIEYRIVGADELDPGGGYLSMDSPLARALLKKAVDDEVLVATPS